MNVSHKTPQCHIQVAGGSDPRVFITSCSPCTRTKIWQVTRSGLETIYDADDSTFGSF